MVVVTQILHQQDGATPIPLSRFSYATEQTPIYVPQGQTCVSLKFESEGAVRIVTSSNRQVENYPFWVPADTYYYLSTGSEVRSTQFLDKAGNKIFVIDDDANPDDAYYDGGVTIWPASRITFDFNLI